MSTASGAVRMAWRTLFLISLYVLSAALVAGCQPTFADLRQELDNGVGGFTGPVIPFVVPYTLRYEPSPEITGTSTVIASDASGQTLVSNTVKARYRLSALGKQRLLEMWVEE